MAKLTRHPRGRHRARHRAGRRSGAGYAASALVFAVVGAIALLGSRAGSAPPQPTRAQAGTLRLASRDVAGATAGSLHQSVPGLGASAGTTALPSPSTPARPVTIGPVLTRSVPVALAISSIGVDTGVLHLPLEPNDTLEAPWFPLLAGWSVDTPTPGQRGTSVIAGHVDSWATGPAVFYRLGDLPLGAHVVVTRADGSHATFVVDAVREYSKADFPSHLVYDSTPRAELRLITCGDWDAATKEYVGNVVVFAHLIRP
jgi:hypothetical protein